MLTAGAAPVRRRIPAGDATSRRLISANRSHRFLGLGRDLGARRISPDGEIGGRSAAAHGLDARRGRERGELTAIGTGGVARGVRVRRGWSVEVAR